MALFIETLGAYRPELRPRCRMARHQRQSTQAIAVLTERGQGGSPRAITLKLGGNVYRTAASTAGTVIVRSDLDYGCYQARHWLYADREEPGRARGQDLSQSLELPESLQKRWEGAVRPARGLR